jgi:hypothetical protein
MQPAVPNRSSKLQIQDQVRTKERALTHDVTEKEGFKEDGDTL